MERKFKHKLYRTITRKLIVMTKLDKLIDKVLEQIQEDVNNGDLTAIEELIKPLPEEQLQGFLSEIEG